MAFQAFNMSQLQASANGAALTSGVVTAVGMQLNAGQKVNNIAFASATAGANVPTHWQFGWYSPAATPARIAISADKTTTAWAANTVENLPMATALIAPATGWYWFAILVVATTVPTILSAPALTTGLLNAGGIIAPQKALAITSGSGLTALPATLAAPATALVVPWVAVS